MHMQNLAVSQSLLREKTKNYSSLIRMLARRVTSEATEWSWKRNPIDELLCEIRRIGSHRVEPLAGMYLNKHIDEWMK